MSQLDTTTLQEAANEGFAWFVRQLTEGGADYDPYVFKQVRWTFKLAFLKGILWQRRRDIAAAKKPA